MRRWLRDVARATLVLGLGLLPGAPPAAAQDPPDVVELGIEEIRRAMAEGRLSARMLVDAYLARIEAYDRRGPALNAVIAVNPRARAIADSLDALYRRSGPVGPLHGVPVLVKDNYDTHDLPTTAGSAALAGSVPPDDAFQVRRLREAGAIILAKTNMAEFAWSAYETVGSALPGYTRNPYATHRVTAGSSGGTAAAVAASFGAVGLGTDTGNSIRGPSAHQALVGIRSTMGLTSRDGIVPLFLDRDIGGPMARTVRDAAIVFQVIAGYDPADPVTEAAVGNMPATGYVPPVEPVSLRDARIGVVRILSDTETADPRVRARFEEALADLRRLGATIVDPVEIRDYEAIHEAGLWCPRFRHDIEAYLASLGDDAPFRTLQELVDSATYHPSIRPRLTGALDEAPLDQSEPCANAARNGARLRAAVREALASNRLDALVYPTWNNPPRLIGDLTTPDGNNSWQLSPPTGLPAITVPMGWVREGEHDLPVGLQILGDAFHEPRLLELAYAYEHATRHRRPPETTPPLR